MKDINFLKKQNLSLSKVSEKDQRLFKIFLTGFTAIAVVFTLVFATSFYLEFRLKKINKQINSVKSTIKSQEPIEAKYLFFVNKLKIIRELFELRSDKQAAIDYFTNLFGPDILISGINYQMKEGILSLQITSPQVFRLEDVLEKLDSPDIETNFKKVSKSQLKRNIYGEYSFNITVTFEDEFKKQLDAEDERNNS